MRSMRSSRSRHSDALGEGLDQGGHFACDPVRPLSKALLELLVLELYRFASHSRIASSPAGT